MEEALELTREIFVIGFTEQFGAFEGGDACMPICGGGVMTISGSNSLIGAG